MSNQNQQGHGNIVDLGDFFQSQDGQLQLGRTPKRARGLLPPIPGQSSAPSTRSNSTATPFQGNHAQMGTVTEINEPSPAGVTVAAPGARKQPAGAHDEDYQRPQRQHQVRNGPAQGQKLVASTPNHAQQ